MIDNFNPSSHVIQISTTQGKKDYLPVQYRLVWFRAECPQGTITTELLDLNRSEECECETSVWNDERRKYEKVIRRARGVAVFKATITDGKGGSATGTKTENAASFADYLEKAETGAIGRGLAALGYGTQFTDDLDEDERVVDSPVQRKAPTYNPDAPATEGQVSTIQKLQKELGMSELASVDGLSFGDCASMLQDLNKRLQAKRRAS